MSAPLWWEETAHPQGIRWETYVGEGCYEVGLYSDEPDDEAQGWEGYLDLFTGKGPETDDYVQTLDNCFGSLAQVCAWTEKLRQNFLARLMELLL